MTVSPSQSAILEAHRLMQAGRLQEALVLAEPVVDKMHICDPAQGMLATIFLRLGRRADAELIIEKALAVHDHARRLGETHSGILSSCISGCDAKNQSREYANKTQS